MLKVFIALFSNYKRVSTEMKKKEKSFFKQIQTMRNTPINVSLLQCVYNVLHTLKVRIIISDFIFLKFMQRYTLDTHILQLSKWNSSYISDAFALFAGCTCAVHYFYNCTCHPVVFIGWEENSNYLDKYVHIAHEKMKLRTRKSFLLLNN